MDLCSFKFYKLLQSMCLIHCPQSPARKVLPRKISNNSIDLWTAEGSCYSTHDNGDLHVCIGRHPQQRLKVTHWLTHHVGMYLVIFERFGFLKWFVMILDPDLVHD